MMLILSTSLSPEKNRNSIGGRAISSLVAAAVCVAGGTGCIYYQQGIEEMAAG